MLQQGVRSITDLMVMPGLINLDFADVRSVMGEMGKAMMGTGEGHGPNRALEAAERAIANPLLDGVSMQGAKGVIISIIGGDDMKLLEVDEAANHIRELVDPNANIIWGSAFNPDLDGKIRVSVVATGIEQSAEQAEVASRPVSIPSTSRGPAVPSAAPSFAPPPSVAAPEPASQPSWTPAAEQVQPAQAAIEAEPTSNDLTLDLSEAQEAPADTGNGELLLGGLEAPAEPAAGATAEPAMPRLGRSPEAAPAKPAGGSTLFERMANLSRGNRDEDEADEGSALNIPRFLGRQNNQ